MGLRNIPEHGGMIINPYALPRFENGDMTALDSIVTFSDGSTKTLRDCNLEDFKVMAAWAAYKSADAGRTLALMDAEMDRRRPKLKAVD